MLIITIIYSLISVLITGSALNPVLRKCDVLTKPDLGESQIQSEEGENKKCCSGFKKLVSRFHQQTTIWF